MLRKVLGIILVVGVTLSNMFTLQRCANPTPPKGGPKDTIGPTMLLEKSTAPFQTNFRPDQIEIAFDEWVKLKDPTQVVISPPLEPAPKISLKKKSLIIDFSNTTLRDSATYVINIGEAVVDLTESNPPENLRFVFATGPVLDSAAVKGRILDAYTKEPLENILFALYSNLADTATQTENPFYFAKTDKNGQYQISNIRPGTYRGIALDNGNQSSYKFNNRFTKQLGFPDSFLIVPATSLVIPDILVSKLPVPLRRLDRDTSNFGVIRLTFDRPAEQLDYRSSNVYSRINNKDTLELYYTDNLEDSLFFGLPDAPDTDTLILLARGQERAKIKGKLKVQSTPDRLLNPLKQPAFKVSRPIQTIHDSLILLTKDTFPDLMPAKAQKDSLESNKFYITTPLKTEERYQIQLLPGAIEDIFGKFNTDTITTTFGVAPLSNFGTLKLELSGFEPDLSYILRLIAPKQDTPVETLQLSGDSLYVRSLPGLSPAIYKVEIITDLNKNGLFDGADYNSQQQPEQVYIFTLEQLRADWEVEAQINLKGLKTKQQN